jgi:preprotein translocase subunit SecD
VAGAAEILAGQSDISHTFIDQAMGPWTINIVFQSDFSRRLIEVNKQHAGEEMAILINGQLVTVPCLNDHPEYSLNADGQFLLAIPTRFSSYEAINQFMQKFNL